MFPLERDNFEPDYIQKYVPARDKAAIAWEYDFVTPYGKNLAKVSNFGILANLLAPEA